MTLARLVAVFVGVVLVLLVGTLFVLQNHEREVQLSLDLGVRAWELKRPVTIPALIATCFFAGLVVGGVPLFVRTLRLQSKLRRMEAVRPTTSDQGGRDTW